MTPPARIAAAIAILDDILSGTAPEPALSRWSRSNRYAGSGDRAVIRDHVFDALRRRRSFAALGGATTGRGLMIGAVRAAGGKLDVVFNGTGYAPPPLTDAEAQHDPGPLPDAVAHDIPDWLETPLRDSLDSDFSAVLTLLQSRAPVFLRVNVAKTNVAEARMALAKDGITTEPHPLANTALEVTENPRKIVSSQAFRDGLVELQDAASQALVADLQMDPAPARILDYCAGGGGKALALAARTQEARVFAHDGLPQRMADLPRRAQRGGASITVIGGECLAREAPFDLVLCDVPCSGSGAWRRQPAAKWELTAERLQALRTLQLEILTTATGHVAPHGTLVYATCSLLNAENNDQIDRFTAAQPDWRCRSRRIYSPLEGGDGFFCAVLTRD